MKKIEAIVKASRLDAIRDALAAMGVSVLTLSEVKGYGGPSAAREGVVPLRGAPYLLDFVPRLKLEIFVSEDQVEPTIAAITEAARTGRVGDGVIAVLPVETFVHIRSRVREPSTQ